MSNRFTKIAAIGFACLGLLAACGQKEANTADQPITVVSREEGSGTRGAFIELFGIETKDAEGKKVDNTTTQAIVTNSTAVMLTTVAGDSSAIGYASLGALDGTTKTLEIDGVTPSVETIISGEYKIARPFNIVTQKSVSDAAQDFISFILSPDGQAIVEKTGYIPVEAGAAYQSKVQSGKVVVAGSSSVNPVMEKLKEAYQTANAGVTVEIQQSDSSTGVTSAIEGSADIGMASRELKDSETSKGVSATAIAMDGIVLIVHKDNPLAGLTVQEVQDIYTGKEGQWSAYISK
ncbi:extracellular solute-binding protein [Streptococcus acidominimus]|uniref:Extracellular solute-binding protein n=1 Tax=Streptococcus acidominimus TaxID=1326 RepID=A0A1Q8EG51_STRAI|nr:extracellular solute-binding protein [Streptococcus acidominimus]MBF0847526.1 extracellular solute-binding protein [Streptococcus danieliae]MBF0818055.1 extracellular solute-binding protein [Streptococcus acidominimus]MBF0838751.1 extracellular solute-binding protein [Streptococcus acidominimus]OLF50795.1 phosphate ABC transporter substrate-binding protein [Streptococcus acidominimus]TFU31774.1 extracellular solute-binding protein [Streptococcus acidominimus]